MALYFLSQINTMSELNPQQLAAIKYIDGPLLVIAGAGSGKTRVITQKIAYLIEECGLSPKHIYAVTFTNKAAKEMAHRAQKLINRNKGQREKIHVSTFHALGLILLKKEAAHLALSPNFTVFDAIDSLNLLKELSGKISAISDDNLKNVHQLLSFWKNSLITPEEALNAASDEQTHLAARFYVAYQQTLHAYNAVDFDDLISLPVKLFQENQAVLEKWQNKVRYLLVDEYQDTNAAQYRFIKLLCGIRQAFTVVGDDDQSIYAWRGAKPENIALLQDDHPHLKVIKLEQNYRSTSTILSAANHLISHNPHVFEKKLWSTLGIGDPIRIIATNNDEIEVERVVHEIVAHQFRYRLSYDNYAILYRNNHQARPLEQVLREHSIPYQMSGGVSFFAHTEIKDLFAYFRLMLNPDDDAAFLRCVNTPKRDIGPATLEKLGLYAKQRQCNLLSACLEMGLKEFLSENAQARVYTFAEDILRAKDNIMQSDDALALVHELIKDMGYFEYISNEAPNAHAAQKRTDNVRHLLGWLERLMDPNGEHQLSFQEAIQRMVLLDIIDRQSSEQNTNAVQLMTLHAAKGLEFQHVYIIGWEEDTLPHKTSIEQDTVNEERRLAYVGMTRAQKSLVLTYAKQRKRYGEWQPIIPSRFLTELPEEYVVREGNIETSPEQQRTAGQAHLSALKALLQQES